MARKPLGAFGRATARQKILADNPAELYGFPPSGTPRQ